MKAVENPEITLVNKIQQLMGNDNNIPELVKLEMETKEIINKNCLSIIQFTASYLIACKNNISSETRTTVEDTLMRILGLDINEIEFKKN